MIDPYDPPHPDGPDDPYDDYRPYSLLTWVADDSENDWDDGWPPEGERR
jgi:hypothetical protein